MKLIEAARMYALYDCPKEKVNKTPKEQLERYYGFLTGSSWIVNKILDKLESKAVNGVLSITLDELYKELGEDSL